MFVVEGIALLTSNVSLLEGYLEAGNPGRRSFCLFLEAVPFIL